MEYYLAVDIGASSGRHVVGWLEDGRLCIREMYRFSNEAIPLRGRLCWDSERLYQEILNGMRVCQSRGFVPKSMGVDTWGVDFALLDQRGKLLGDMVAYRDSRTDGMTKEVRRLISDQELYAATGIQKQPFNTIYQLTSMLSQEPQALGSARYLLLMPDYLHYRLTGRMVSEYTNATTTGLVNARQRDWDRKLIERLGLPECIFLPLSMPGTVLGRISGQTAKQVGFDCEVVLPATHDTASAVLSVPSTEEDFLYLSSGTWSLMGTELVEPLCNEEARQLNFTNEGGAQKRYRFLKNIMGLWMIQSVKQEYGFQYSFDDLSALARKAEGFPSVADVNAPMFLAPQSMTQAVKQYCKNTGQLVPDSVGEVMSVIYRGLAQSYGQTVRQIEKLTGKRRKNLYIVGGGSKDAYLNQLTAQETGLCVFTGPSEATAIGNLLAQMIHAGVLDGVREARRIVAASLPVQKVSQG